MRLAGGARELDQVLDEHDAQNVVQVFLVDRDTGILLLTEEGAQLVKRRVRLDGDDIGSRCHDLADQRVAEVHDGLEEPPLVAFDEALLFACFQVCVRRLTGFFLGGGGHCLRPLPLAIAAAFDEQTHKRAGHRMEESRRVVERRQEELQHALRIAAHDQHRQHVLEHEDEHRDEDEEHSDRLKARAPRQHRDHDRREGKDQSQHQPRRDEELDRIFEVEAEPVVPAPTLRDQAERQPHQRTERRLDGAHIDRTDGQQQKEKGGEHHSPARSINPAGSPPRRRSRASTRAIRPLSSNA